MIEKKSAVIPVRKVGKKFEVLLINNIDKTKWIIPKGNIDFPLPAFLSATKEAYEEAGVIGKTHAFSFGKYFRNNQQIPTYVMEVDLFLDHFDEKKYRVRKWVKPAELKKYIAEKDLREVILESLAALQNKGKYFKLMIENFSQQSDFQLVKLKKKFALLKIKTKEKDYKVAIERNKNMLHFSLKFDFEKEKQKVNKNIMTIILEENNKNNLGFWSIYQTKKSENYKIKRSHQTDIFQINETVFEKIIKTLIKDCVDLSKKLV